MLIFGNGSPLLQTRNTVPSQTMTQLSASSLPRRSRTAASSFDAPGGGGTAAAAAKSKGEM